MNIQKNKLPRWTKNTFCKELKEVAAKLGHFPSSSELLALKKSALIYRMTAFGGAYKLALLLGYKNVDKPRGYWSEERVVCELKKLAARYGRFPTQLEMRRESTTLRCRVAKFGGVEKFRRLLGYKKVVGDRDYWTEEVIVLELKKLAAVLGHFPSHSERLRTSTTLVARITKFGGIDKFRRLSGYVERAKGSRSL